MSRDLIHPMCSSKYITTHKNIVHFYMQKHPIRYYYHLLALLLLLGYYYYDDDDDHHHYYYYY